MSVEPVPVEDPNDPQVILSDLPERERGQFLRQYHEAVDAAHDPAGYRRLQRLLHAWRLTVIATSRVGYYEELEAVQNGSAQTIPAEAFDALIAARSRERGALDDVGGPPHSVASPDRRSGTGQPFPERAVAEQPAKRLMHLGVREAVSVE